MQPTPAALLGLAYFMLAGQNLASGQLGPKPQISVIPDHYAIQGENLTIRCTGPQDGLTFTLAKNGNMSWEERPSGQEAEFHITGAEEKDGGGYTCRYKLQSDPPAWSEPSDTLEVTVQESYLEPSIRVRPQRVTPRGRDLVIQCSGRRTNMTFTLTKDSKNLQQKDPGGKEAEFPIPGASEKDVGQYICYYCTRPGVPKVCSEFSDPVIINVTDLPKPWISWGKYSDVEGEYSVLCSAPEKHRGSWFCLYNGSDLVEEKKAESQAIQVAFSINQSAGEYRCLYRVIVSGDLANSPLSDYVGTGESSISKSPGADFTGGNAFRLVLAGLVFTLTVLIIAEAWYERKKEGRQTTTRTPKNQRQQEDFEQTICVQDSL